MEDEQASLSAKSTKKPEGEDFGLADFSGDIEFTEKKASRRRDASGLLIPAIALIGIAVAGVYAMSAFDLFGDSEADVSEVAALQAQMERAEPVPGVDQATPSPEESETPASETALPGVPPEASKDVTAPEGLSEETPVEPVAESMPPQPEAIANPEVAVTEGAAGAEAMYDMALNSSMGDVPPPSPDSAQEPATNGGMPGLPAGTPDAAQVIPAIPENVLVEADPGAYYDSNAIIKPDTQMQEDAGPRKVDPQKEPASKFIIVEKNAGPDEAASMVEAGKRALKLGRYESAMNIFEKLYEKNPKDQGILMGLAVARQKSGYLESAVKTYEELLALDPENTDALVNMLGIIKGQYPSVALRRLMDLWERFPRNAGIAAQIGMISAEVGSYEDAMRFLGIAASMEPRNALHPYNMAVLSDRKGLKDQAIKFYEQALEADAAYAGRAISRETIYDRLAVLRRR